MIAIAVARLRLHLILKATTCLLFLALVVEILPLEMYTSIMLSYSGTLGVVNKDIAFLKMLQRNHLFLTPVI